MAVENATNEQIDSLIELLSYTDSLSMPADERLSLVHHQIVKLVAPCDLLVLAEDSVMSHGLKILLHINHAGIVFENYESMLTIDPNKPVLVDEDLYDVLAVNQNVVLTDDQINELKAGHKIFGKVSSVMVIPLFYDDHIPRWVLLAFDGSADAHKQLADNQIIKLISRFFALLYRDEQLNQYRERYEWVQEELQNVAKLQRMLLPQDQTGIEGIEAVASFRPCVYAGGDYYDLAPIRSLETPADSDQRSFWGAMIADSAGHGTSAAVEVSMFDAILRTYQGDDTELSETPAGVLNYANRFLFTRLVRGTFITAFVTGYDPEAQKIIYANAGHPAALLYQAESGQVVELEKTGGIPLGVTREYNWENATVDFREGDILLMYTDGILEAESPLGEHYGKQRIIDLLLHYCHEPVRNIRTRLELSLDDFQSGRERKDDQTFLLIKHL